MRSEFPGLLYCAGANRSDLLGSFHVLERSPSERPNSIHPEIARHLDTVPREFGAGSRIISDF